MLATQTLPTNWIHVSRLQWIYSLSTLKLRDSHAITLYLLYKLDPCKSSAMGLFSCALQLLNRIALETVGMWKDRTLEHNRTCVTIGLWKDRTLEQNRTCETTF